MPSYVRYHEVTLYVIRMLDEVVQQELPLSERRITIQFIEPIYRVWKGITNAKAELVKKPEYRKYINYRLIGIKNFEDKSITFGIETYVKDIQRVRF